MLALYGGLQTDYNVTSKSSEGKKKNEVVGLAVLRKIFNAAAFKEKNLSIEAVEICSIEFIEQGKTKRLTLSYAPTQPDLWSLSMELIYGA